MFSGPELSVCWSVFGICPTSDFLPPTAENRRPLDLTAKTPWEDHREVTITTADHLTKGAATADATLREDTLNRIKDIKTDYTIYTEGSASSGLWDGGRAAIITTGNPEAP